MTSDETTSPVGPLADEKPAQDWIELPGADALTESNASTVLFRYPCTKILLAGATQSGKTSLTTAIYERLCQGSFDGWTFGSSATLIGFEKRCWEGRTGSGGLRDSIRRTSLQADDYLLHLDVVSSEARRRHLLLADLSGEVFQEMKLHPAAAADLPILAAADHVAIFVDGARLAVTAERQVAINDGVACMRACLDHGPIGSDFAIELVIAKWDLAVDGGVTESWVNEHVIPALEVPAKRHGGAVRHFLTAARPTKGGFELGSGVAALISEWVKSPSKSQVASPSMRSDARQFLRYGHDRAH
jgi:hypothetical protein